MSHERAFRRLPDLLFDRDEPELLEHVAACGECQRQLFLLTRVDRLVRETAAARRPRKGRWLRFPAGLAAVVAAALAVLLLLPHHDAAHRFTLRLASGQPIGQAVLTPGDARNMSLSLVAQGLPTRPRNVYLLWAGGDGRSATTVGRFMVDPNGACRARFTLPGRRGWTRFWVTPTRNPGLVVPAT